MPKKYTMTFFEYMQQYPHTKQNRRLLADELRRIAEHYVEIKEIDSLVDLMTKAPQLVKDGRALAAINGRLWSEYCAVAGRPFFEECFSNDRNQKRGRKKDLA